MDSLDHPALFIMSLIGTPKDITLLVEAALTTTGSKTVVLIPDIEKTSLIHLDIGTLTADL